MNDITLPRDAWSLLVFKAQNELEARQQASLFGGQLMADSLNERQFIAQLQRLLDQATLASTTAVRQTEADAAAVAAARRELEKAEKLRARARAEERARLERRAQARQDEWAMLRFGANSLPRADRPMAFPGHRAPGGCLHQRGLGPPGLAPLRAGLAGPAPGLRVAREAVVLTLLQAALVQAQARGLLPATGWVDLGPALQSLEGAWHLALPQLQPAWAAWSWLGLYLYAFPALLFGVVIALHGCRETALLQRFLGAANLVAWSALPVFAAIGVPEVWMQLADYQPPVVTVGEGLSFYRLLSGPHNCLPSLHCTLALLAGLVCWRSGVPTLRWLGPVVALLVCLSPVAAGIHWLVDVAVSLPWAAAAWAWASRRGQRRVAGAGA